MRISILCFAVCVSASFLPHKEHGSKKQDPKSIIIDTDMLNFQQDDDPLAIGLANVFHMHDEARVLGIIDKALGAAVPVAIKKPVDNSPQTIDTEYPSYREYLTGLTYNFPEDIKDGSNTTTPIRLYRQLLSQAPHNSVTITAIGFLNNLYDLLHSQSDDITNLNGFELVREKVAELVVQGNPTGSSFNFLRYNATYAEYVLTKWPGRITFVPDAIGDSVYIGRRLTTELDINVHPVAYSFATCIGINQTHQAWDGKCFYV
ncbi:MAG: hypothetical protein Q9160_003951 [Pyrenula sp. 1 TL-2023]